MARDILVVAEHLQGRLADITFELLGTARAVADALGARAEVLLAGHGVAPLTAELGAADQVLAADHPALGGCNPEALARVAAAVVQERGPRLVLTGYTSAGMDLAGALGGRLGLPVVSYCTGIQVRDGQLATSCQLYGGKLVATAHPEGATCVVSMLAGAGTADRGRAAGAPAVAAVALPELDGLRVRFKQLIAPEAGDVDITREPVLVAVGRGIGDAANLELARELADALGAPVAASRPVIDNGWLPRSRQVGKSGFTVKPRCYLAVGISGAPEHLEGMRDSALIVAINTDPGAPIFGVAHYGAVADLFDVLPALTEKIAAVR